MASIRRQKIGNRTYWQIVESHRVNGKPKPKVIKHLGTTEKLLELINGQESPHEGFVFRSYSHGDVASLLKIAKETGIMSTMERIFPSQQRKSLNVGKILLVGAIHRAIKPSSKRSFGTWAQTTTISRLMGFGTEKLTSQDFWDQMKVVTKENILSCQEAMCKILEERNLISDSLLHYDLTNYFTYIATTNLRSNLTKRGHSKQKRDDLRCFGLSQVVTKDFLLPVFSRLYEGNGSDAKQFSHTINSLKEFVTGISREISDITLVFDRGSNSKSNFESLDTENIGYVACLSPIHHKDLINIPIDAYSDIEVNNLIYPSYRTRKSVWGKQRTIVVLLSSRLKEGQIRGWDKQINKIKDELEELKNSLNSDRSRRTTALVTLKVQKIVHSFHGIDLFETDIKDEKKPKLTWKFDEAKYEELKTLYAGKRILVTNRDDWTTEDIISAYHGQANVERVFKSTKNPFHNAIRPQYHYTDHMIEVHVFICLTGFLLTQLLFYKLKVKNIEVTSIEDMLERLNKVRELEIVEKTNKAGRPKITRQLESCSKELRQLFDAAMSDMQE
jgi:transposase